jgi:hypothetical protein
MSEAANKELAKRWFEEVWNQGRESTIDQLLHPDGKATGKKTTVPGSSFIHCRDGKITDGWNFMNRPQRLNNSRTNNWTIKPD